MRLVLASTSAYRRALLQRLGLEFACVPPKADETPQAGEPPASLAQRLAHAKAEAVAGHYPDSLIIGSDQAAAYASTIVGKPENHARAAEQLRSFSGQTVMFFTAVCVLNTRTGQCQEHLDTTRVRFRALGTEEIEHYLQTERPYDCTGSFKSEGLGISLLEAIESEDPTALVGLPLITLCRFLRAAGMTLP